MPFTPDIHATGLVITLALFVGCVAEPIRVVQALRGSLGSRLGVSDAGRRRAARLFYWAFPFWLGLLWAAFNIQVLKSCSGDTCIGYSLPAFPFPFLYGIGELVLLSERQPRADR
ncbi:hypothetical protein GCM10007933_10760 [Zoogloea oryzae]|uniref:Uncharacterized protein n=1 Tax=Zoogloea oryzae TaxID=310767 RepID=A0ABQ6F8Q8_9RHOO|nr:hypothetical protein [Zoogloea oryzae]GLT21624.1 hypothetical protein GCM10007933_10760 [Zoogloea oryzae]